MADPDTLTRAHATSRPASVRVLADDLTGAADAGVAFARDGLRVDVLLHPAAARPAAAGPAGPAWVTVVDTDTREATAATAHATVRRAAARLSRHDHVLKKIDSLLRGPVAGELAALRAAQPGRLLIVAPAIPAQGRVTRDGAVLLTGPAGLAAARATPLPVARRLDGGPVHHLGLSVIRARRGVLAGALETAAACRATAVCDAVTDADLDLIVAAGLAMRRPVLWIGAAGLAGALARALRPVSCVPGPLATPTAAAPLVIVGSPSPAARAQLRALVADGARWTDLNAADLLALTARELAGRAAALAERPAGAAVISVSGEVDPRARAAVASALARLCAPAVARAELTVVTGGATARAVLTRAGVTALTLLGEVAPGVVLSRAAAGTGPAPAGPRCGRARHIITKSGSFGGPDALASLVSAASGERGES